MDKNKSVQAGKLDRFEMIIPKGSQFGEFDGTGVGVDLTLEWDSNDPDLHEYIREVAQVKELANTRKWIVPRNDDEDRYRYFKDAGLPDA